MVIAFFIKPGDQAPDANRFIIFFVPVVKNDADGIDKKEPACSKNIKICLPGLTIHLKGKIVVTYIHANARKIVFPKATFRQQP